MNRRVGAGAALFLLALTTGCGSDDSASGTQGTVQSTPKPTKTPRPGPPSVTIKNNKVTPATLEVETGQTVKIINNDSVGHRLDSSKDHLYSGTIPAKGKGELTAPPDPGTYQFADPTSSSVRLKLKVR